MTDPVSAGAIAGAMALGSAARPIDEKALFDAIRAIKGRPLVQADVDMVKRALTGEERPGVPIPLAAAPASTFDPKKPAITPRVALELIEHEAIVLEAYKDSEGIWTWGIGVTNASGHQVHPRYKDKPQTIRRCLEVYIWLLRERYLPAVLKEFEGHALTEAQFAAALSFHYNTGSIEPANWADLWKAGKVEAAREAFMNWKKPPSIIGRREKERDLFFDGKWTQDGVAVVYPVSKPSYQPNFRAARHVDVRADVNELLA